MSGLATFGPEPLQSCPTPWLAVKSWLAGEEGARMAQVRQQALVIVAHPDDETLWCGGFVLEHASWRWHVVTLCRASDPDRAPKFNKVLKYLGATGAMGDLDDGPGQKPLDLSDLKAVIRQLAPGEHWHLVLTHGPAGEYTRHHRHEECSRAVAAMWADGTLRTEALWMFAYEDGGGAYLPRVQDSAECRYELPEDLWQRKHRLVTHLYGFSPDSWEARVTPREEGFRPFGSPAEAAVCISAMEISS